MEGNHNQPESSMDSLKGMLQEQFPEIVRIVTYEGLEDFDVEIEENTVAPPFVKALNEYLGRFILDYGDPEASYNVTIQRGRELIDILRYNDPDTEHYIEIEMDGNPTRLRIVDVLGCTGDYSVFNENFENLGFFFTEDDVYFGDASSWQTNQDGLKPYLEEIVRKIENKVHKSGSENIDPNDPLNMEFYAEQFEISTEELKKAIESAGTSIFAITKFLQK